MKITARKIQSYFTKFAVVALALAVSACGGSSSTTAKSGTPAATVIGGGTNVALTIAGKVVLLAGTGTALHSADLATGSGAGFNVVKGITTDGTNIYALDSSGSSIRKVVISTGVTTTIAGGSGAALLSGYSDGYGTGGWFSEVNGIISVHNATGAATIGLVNGVPTKGALFNAPMGITYASNKLFVADTGNNAIRQISLSGTGYPVTTLAGSGVDYFLNNVGGSTMSGASLYSGATVVGLWSGAQLGAGGFTGGQLGGSGGGMAGYADGTASGAAFNNPTGLTTDGTNIYVADQNNNVIRKVVIASGVVTTLAGGGNTGAISGSGATGFRDGNGSGQTLFNLPSDITFDGTNLYVLDQNGTVIRKVTTAGVVTTVGNLLGVSGIAAKNITTDGTYVYITDPATGKNVVRMTITTGYVAIPYSGVVSTSLAGITTDGTNIFIASNFAVFEMN